MGAFLPLVIWLVFFFCKVFLFFFLAFRWRESKPFGQAVCPASPPFLGSGLWRS